MKSFFIEHPPTFHAFSPKQNWADALFGIQGSSIVSFVAPLSHFCTEESIPSSSETLCIHLLIEHLDVSYSEMLLWQRILTYASQDRLVPSLPIKENRSHAFWSESSCIVYLGIELFEPLEPELLRSLCLDINFAYIKEVDAIHISLKDTPHL